MKLEVTEEFVKEAHKAACEEWKKKIEAQFPTVFPKNTYKVGERLIHLKSEEYIIARVGIEGGDTLINLISLRDGNRWSDPFKYSESKIPTDKFESWLGRMEDWKKPK